ncbi:MFS family permease [Catenulispora sp. GAS73]|uniref:MFS transporter n=1 Tax=Catenulispora sp. GAS73 TaxID=3156269 RepID=UPI0035133991
MKVVMSDSRVRAFYLASAISTFGDYALYIALAVWVKILTGSTGESGVTFLMPILGALCLPLTGVIVDRVRRKRLLIGTYLGTAVLVAAMLAVHSRDQVWIIYVVAFFYGISGPMSFGAQQALITKIVPEDLLADANAVQQTTTQGMRLITPLVGVGLLSWLGAHAVVLVDMGTFLVAASLLLGVRVDEAEASADTEPGQEDGPADRRRWTADIATGFRYVASAPVLRQMCFALAVTVFFMSFYETIDLQIATVGLHHKPSWVGLMVSMQGVGGLVGGFTAGRIARRIGDGLLTVTGLAAMTAFSLLSAVPVSAVVLVAAVFFGLGMPWVFVGAMTITQKSTPNAMMGRVGGVVDLSITAPQSVGIAVGAAVIDHVDYRDLCFMVAVGVGAAAIYLTTRKEQRRASEPVPSTTAEERDGAEPGKESGVPALNGL